MNGAESLLKTLIDAGVEVCFANPGTSEMQFVAKMDECEGMQPVLTLFEGVATGAADGYARMADKPASTLLHLGPGLANGMANLHNARRAGSPMVNVIGDHATYHLPYDAPLTSDVVGHATPVSDWVRVSESANDLANDGAAAVAASLEGGGKITSLIVPADYSWSDASEPVAPLPAPELKAPEADILAQAKSALLSGEPSAILLGGRALRASTLAEAGRIAQATGARLICETFTARLERGAGRVQVERLPYFGEMAAEFLKDLKHLITIGTKPPVSFFAYPNKPSWLSPEGCNTITLTDLDGDAHKAVSQLFQSLDLDQGPAPVQAAVIPELPNGKLTAEGIGAVVADLMPENAIVSDESATAGLAIFPMTAGAAPHDWLMLTGGAIGQGLPVAVGAAVACPDRKVLALQADGSGMYTVQSLWTMARENLDITTVIINNGSYAVLNIELARVGVDNPGPKALSMLDLTKPEINWVAISEGMGVSAKRVTTVEELHIELQEALQYKGPKLIEAIL